MPHQQVNCTFHCVTHATTVGGQYDKWKRSEISLAPQSVISTLVVLWWWRQTGMPRNVPGSNPDADSSLNERMWFSAVTGTADRKAAPRDCTLHNL